MAAHALLGASSAHRWMACPGSVRLSAGQSTPSSDFAIEGTHAHTLGEMCLLQGKQPLDQVGLTFRDHEGEFEVSEDMAAAVTVYTDFIRHIVDDQHVNPDCVEVRVGLTDLHPDMWGTADFVAWDNDAKLLHVVDYKHGRGHAVDVKDNPQALFYAAGARRLYPDVETIRISIVQPRADHPDGPIRTEEYDWIDLLGFEQQLKRAAFATQDPDAPLAAGEHCKFCPAAAFCDVRRESIEALAQDAFGDLPEPSTLSMDRLGALLRRSQEIKDWIASVEKYAHAQAQQGNVPAGFKIVQKQGHRKWSDEDAVIATLTRAGVNGDIFAPQKLKSPAQLEKTVGKAAMAAVADLIVRNESSNLAPVDDPRPAVSRGPEAEFGDLV